MEKFEVILLGVIFDPAKRKVLLGRRENDPHISRLAWCFPSGRLLHNEDLDQKLKKKIKESTGYNVKNLGSIFTRNLPYDGGDFLQVYFLVEIFEGEEKAGGDLVELKWVDPDEVESYFTTPFHSVLKEYISNLK